MTQSTTTGIALVVLAAVLWSSTVLPQTTLLDGWPREFGGRVGFLARLFRVSAIAPFGSTPDVASNHDPDDDLLRCHDWTYLTAIVNGSPANTIWLQNLAPAWVMIGAVLFFMNGPRPVTGHDDDLCYRRIVHFVMEFLYVAPSPEHRWWSPVLAIASGLSYAGVIVCVKALRNHESAWLIALNHIATAIIMLPIVWWSGVSFPSGSMWFLLAGIGMRKWGSVFALCSRVCERLQAILLRSSRCLSPFCCRYGCTDTPS